MIPFIGITSDYSENSFALKDSYITALHVIGFDVCILPVIPGVSSMPEKLDGVVISGGDDIHPSYYGEEPFSGLKLIDNRRTDFEIAVFMECLKMNKPVLGICNGMQLMNVALGGSLYQDIAGQIPVAINHGNGYHNINISDSSLLEGGAYPVNTSHHQAVKQTGGGVHIIARSSDGVIEAFSVENQHFSLGVQWHPERDLDNTLNRQVLLRFKEACIAGK